MSRPPASIRSSPGQPPKPCRIWVVEDQAAAREFFLAFMATVPGFKTVGASERADPALAAAAEGRLDLVVLDLMLPDDGGMSALAKFRRLPNAPKALIYSATVTTHSVQMAISHGALGYVEKTEPLPELRAALERVRSGGMHLSPRASRMLCALVHPGAAGDPRPEPMECQMLELLARGATLKAVAFELKISYPKAHRLRQTLMTRARVARPADLVGYAAAIGLLGSRPAGRGSVPKKGG